MTRTELIQAIADESEMEKKQAKVFLESLTTLVENSLKKGGEVPLKGPHDQITTIKRVGVHVTLNIVPPNAHRTYRTAQRNEVVGGGDCRAVDVKFTQ